MAVVSRDVYQYQKFNILLSARPGEFSFWSDRGEEKLKLKLRCFHRRSAQADLSWLSARVETLDLIQRDGSGETLRSGWTPTLGGSTEMTELKQSWKIMSASTDRGHRLLQDGVGGGGRVWESELWATQQLRVKTNRFTFVFEENYFLKNFHTIYKTVEQYFSHSQGARQGLPMEYGTLDVSVPLL